MLRTNDGLNYGRFDAPGLEVHSYEFSATAEEIIGAFSKAFDDLVTEMRVDDRNDEDPSPLLRMGYPTLQDAFAQPNDLAEVIEIFLDRNILEHFVPGTELSEFVINSTDSIHVDQYAVLLRGRCFRRGAPEHGSCPTSR